VRNLAVQSIADGLFGKGFNPVGQQVAFNGVRFRIIGLLEKKGSSGIGDQDTVGRESPRAP